jgi:hypothetical protein
MSNVIECRQCGRRYVLQMAVHQHELAQVGMLEQHCFRCGVIARWQLVAEVRHSERRVSDRRADDRRRLMQAPLLGRERRNARERRSGPVRKGERRLEEARG